MVKKIKWVGTLSTTERNNIGLIQVRQNNVNSEVLGFNIIDGNGEPYDLKNRKVLFCTYFDKLSPVEQYAEVIENGKIIYTMNEHDMQKPVRINFAYFKIMDDKNNLVDTTQNFSYDIVSSIDSKCMNSEPYVIRLEELFEVYISFMDQQMLDWETFIGQYREVIESIDPNGKLLEEIITARTDETGKKFDTIYDRLNQYTFESFFYTDVSDEVENIYKFELKKLRESINQNLFSFIFHTDSHYLDNRREVTPIYKNGLKHINNALAFDGYVDTIIYGGDNTHSEYLDVNDIRKDIEKISNKILIRDNRSDHFIIVGNHDDGSERVTPARLGDRLTPEKRISEADFKNILMTTKKQFQESRDNDSLYFYKDYPDRKIRLIGLYTNDIPDDMTRDDGRIKYTRWHTHAYRQEQLNWLANDALKTVPDGFHVLITGHYPLAYLGTTLEVHTNETIDPEKDQAINHELLAKLLIDFKNGGSGKLVNNLTDFPVNIDYSFDKNGTLIGIVNGHTHMERIFDYQGIKIIHCLNSLGVKSKTSEPERAEGSLTEEAFYLGEIDTEVKKLTLKGFGAATTREITY